MKIRGQLYTNLLPVRYMVVVAQVLYGKKMIIIITSLTFLIRKPAACASCSDASTDAEVPAETDSRIKAHWTAIDTLKA